MRCRHPLSSASLVCPPPSSLRILVYLVIYDSGQVFLEHLLLSRYPPQRSTGTTRGLSRRGAPPPSRLPRSSAPSLSLAYKTVGTRYKTVKDQNRQSHFARTRMGSRRSSCAAATLSLSFASLVNPHPLLTSLASYGSSMSRSLGPPYVCGERQLAVASQGPCTPPPPCRPPRWSAPPSASRNNYCAEM